MKAYVPILVGVVAIVLVTVSAQATVIDGTFVPVTGNATSATTPWYESSTNSDTDNLWFHVGGDDTYLAYRSESAPMFTTSATGLDADRKYSLSVLFQGGNADWAVQAAKSGETLQQYDHTSVGALDTDRLGNPPEQVDYWQVPVFEISGVTTASMDIAQVVGGGGGGGSRVWGIAYKDIGAVPEPSSLVLLACGLLGLLAYAWRNRK